MRFVQKIFPGIALWLVSATACYAADDYMDALEAEADDTAAQAALTHQERPAKRKAGLQNRDVVKPGLAFTGFEEELDTSFSGSYFLYVNLNSRQRKAVFRYYQEDNQIESIREEIVRQLSSD